MQTKITLISLFFTIFLVSGCGISKPFVDTRREAGKTYMVGESTIDTVAICYNSMTFDAEKLKEMANNECAKTDRVAKFKKQRLFSCRFFTPTRAYFDCIEIADDGTEIYNKKQTVETINQIKVDEKNENTELNNDDDEDSDDENSPF